MRHTYLVFFKNFPSIIDILFLNGTSAFRIVLLFYKFPIGFVRIYAHNSLTYSPRSYSRVKFHFIFVSSLDESTDYLHLRANGDHLVNRIIVFLSKGRTFSATIFLTVNRHEWKFANGTYSILNHTEMH